MLYVGLALTSTGPRVVEFNVRFGDPETQVVLARLRTPLGGLLMAAATGGLAAFEQLSWSEGAAVTVVLAAEGYPESPRSGDPIEGLAAAGAVPGVRVLHAGTAGRGRAGRLGRRPGALGGRHREPTWPPPGTRRTPGWPRSRCAGGHFRSDIALAAAQ